MTAHHFARRRAGYVAPEDRARISEGGEGEDDVFAAGVLLWEPLAQRPLFGGLPDTPVGASARHLLLRQVHQAVGEAVPPLPTDRKKFPTGLDSSLARALAAAPGARFSNAAEFRNAIAEFLPAEAARRAAAANFVKQFVRHSSAPHPAERIGLIASAEIIAATAARARAGRRHAAEDQRSTMRARHWSDGRRARRRTRWR